MNDEQLALDNCDKEPVHIPGRIQSFGALLAFDLDNQKIVHFSDNLNSLILPDRSIALGQNYEETIGNREVVHAVRCSIGLPTIRAQRDRAGGFELSSLTDVSVFVTDNLGVIEFEPDFRQSTWKPSASITMVRSMMSAIDSAQDLDELLTASVASLRRLTGHDRVMAYRFLPNGDGEVVAESKANGIEPYLGLRYPASDIPTQVRQIMLRSPFRIIADIQSQPAALISQPDAPPLDLTLGHSRGVSPIHIEYLANMGVRATMNISIIVRGKLWGLFAFHHFRPRKLVPDQRSICELIGNLASMKIQQAEEFSRVKMRERTFALVSSLDSDSTQPGEILTNSGDDLLSVVECNGVAFLETEFWTTIGETPSATAFEKLKALARDEITTIRNLSATGNFNESELGKSAGAMIVRIHDSSQLIFFRNEEIHEVRWAGGQDKQITTGPNGPRLTPRESFAEYKESITGSCRAWSEANHDSALEIRRELMRSMIASNKLQSQQWKRQKKYQDLLLAELNHRVRNTIALVRSIARQTKASSVSLEHYVESLEQRIGALSAAHDLIGGSGHQWAKIEDLIESELKPYQSDSNQVSYGGPPLTVRADVAPVLSLLLHEMTSNAVKHGGLSTDSGCVQIQWCNEAGAARIDWTEHKGELFPKPERRGFGIELMERALTFECGGRSKVHFRTDGVDIQLWIPAESVRFEQADSPRLIEGSSVSAAPEFMLGIQSVLVVEDNMVLALELERILFELNIDRVLSIPNTELALEAIDREKFDCVILDINLGGQFSFEFAVALQDKEIPIIFASGYGNELKLPRELTNIPRLVKPISRLDIAEALSLVIQQHNP